jgi:hypothetical protein
LDPVAVEVAEDLELGVGFYAFGDDGHAQGVGRGDDVFDDGPVDLGSDYAFDEEAVDFEGVEGELAEAAERGVAGAEVVDGDTEAVGAELAEVALGQDEVVDQGGFGDFELDDARWGVVLAQGEDDGGDEVFAGQFEAGDVDGDAAEDQAAAEPVGGLFAGFMEDEAA